MSDQFFQEIDGKLYATGRAYVVTEPNQLPREIASDFSDLKMNPSFLWVAGRYVQANKPNKNGHFWTTEDLQVGERTVRYTPMNVLHRWHQPVGAFVQTKIVSRLTADKEEDLPEIQALAVLWAANFPEVAAKVKESHEAKTLWFSMECVSEKKQCMACEEVFEFSTPNSLACAHLATSKSAPRRFINPVFLGGALIFPPESPAWPEADVSELAQRFTEEYAHRSGMDAGEWESMMGLVQRVTA